MIYSEWYHVFLPRDYSPFLFSDFDMSDAENLFHFVHYFPTIGNTDSHFILFSQFSFVVKNAF